MKPSTPRPVAANRRSQRTGDAAFLLDLFVAVQGETFAGLDPKLRDRLLRQQFAGQDATYRADHPGGRFEVIEVDGAPVGRVVSGRDGDALAVVDLALMSAWQGRGIGGSILRALQGEAHAAGLPLRASVLRSNEGSRRFHEKLGFTASGGTETHLHMRWTP